MILEEKEHYIEIDIKLSDGTGIKKLWVCFDNERAIHIYEKLGFRKSNVWIAEKKNH